MITPFYSIKKVSFENLVFFFPNLKTQKTPTKKYEIHFEKNAEGKSPPSQSNKKTNLVIDVSKVLSAKTVCI